MNSSFATSRQELDVLIVDSPYLAQREEREQGDGRETKTTGCDLAVERCSFRRIGDILGPQVIATIARPQLLDRLQDGPLRGVQSTCLPVVLNASRQCRLIVEDGDQPLVGGLCPFDLS
jgi:hypothetical protein